MSNRQIIIDDTEAQIETIIEKLSEKVSEEIRNTLAGWEARWPSHKFAAFQSHGMLQITVYPRIGDMRGPLANNVHHIPDRFHRGAIATLIEEADDLINWHCQLEWGVSTPDETYKTIELNNEEDE